MKKILTHNGVITANDLLMISLAKLRFDEITYVVCIERNYDPGDVGYDTIINNMSDTNKYPHTYNRIDELLDSLEKDGIIEKDVKELFLDNKEINEKIANMIITFYNDEGHPSGIRINNAVDLLDVYIKEVTNRADVEAYQYAEYSLKSALNKGIK